MLHYRRLMGAVAAVLAVIWILGVLSRTHNNNHSIVHIPLSDFDFHAVATVDPRYVSFTLDWWPPDQGSPFPPPAGWGPHANVLEVDLQDSKLRALVTALGPSILRIGGTMDKIVEYDFPEYGSVCTGQVDNFVDGRPRPCLNASRWDELHEFAGATDSQIVFGLSYPETPAKDGTWNSSPAEALMRYSKQQNCTRQTTLVGFELGEELTRFEAGTQEFENYANAYHTCADLLRKIFNEDNGDGAVDDKTSMRPLLMGPCPGMAWPTLATWFPAFLLATREVLDVAVYHSYNQIEYPDKFYLNQTVPSGNISTQHGTAPGDTGWQAVAMKGFMDDINRNGNHTPISLWLGEMGSHNGGGGRGNISSTFASSFGYMDTLGTLARLNHLVLARQTLVGGKYELLRCTTGLDGVCDFEPSPEYYVAVLWSRLMGTTVLNAPGDESMKDINGHDWRNDLHFHAHCSNFGSGQDGSITLAFSNKSPDTAYAVPTSDWGSIRVEYILQAHVPDTVKSTAHENSHDERFDARQVSLNGKLLHMGNTSRLPKMVGNRISNDEANPLMISPTTLGFLQFPNAGIAACSSQTGK